MKPIDRTGSRPLHDQIADRFRYAIVTGQYRTGDSLPSTRKIASEVDVSFHTARRGLQTLEAEGWVEARAGRPYRVVRSAPVGTDRMERGAALLQDTLRQLAALGLDDAEIEYLIDEQLAQDPGSDRHRVLFVDRTHELATLCIDQLRVRGIHGVDPARLDDLETHADADYAMAPHRLVRSVMQALPGTDVVGVSMLLPERVQDTASRMLPHETLGVVALEADSIQPLIDMLRRQTGFSGQIVAIVAAHGARHVAQLLTQTDRIIYTRAAERRIRAALPAGIPHARIDSLLSDQALRSAASRLPSSLSE